MSFEKSHPEKPLTVVMPAYNEEATIKLVLERVLEQPLVGEVVVVDDCSADRTVQIVEGLAAFDERIKLLCHKRNQGKGAALRTGFQGASLPFVIIQDADLEYDPSEFNLVVEPLMIGRADVCYGSRYAMPERRRVLRFWHTMGNKFLTLLSNMATDLHLTDMETCYKAFRREVIQSISIEENRFGFEPEITAKVAHRQLRVMEVAVSYYPRSYDEGKHIGWKDGVRAIYCIVKYGVFRGRRLRQEAADLRAAAAAAEA